MLLSLGISLFASELIVKKADVKISINGEEKELIKDSEISIDPGSTICFLDGDGKVIIDRKKQLTKKSRKCYSTPIPEGFDMSKLVSNLVDSAKVALITGDLKVKNGVSTKSIDTTDVVTGYYPITNKDRKIIIYNENYGPLPVTLALYDTEKNIKKMYVNEDSVSTFFILSTKDLKNKYSIVVTNAFEDELLRQVIVKTEKSKEEK
jgi:hypothetical protein